MMIIIFRTIIAIGGSPAECRKMKENKKHLEEQLEDYV